MWKRPLRGVVLAAALAGCGGAEAPQIGAPEPSVTDPACPVEVPGTSVSVEDTETGAALVFVTTGDEAAVRQRAGEMARIHNEHHASMGPLPTGNETAEAAGHEHHHHHHGAEGAHGGQAEHGAHAGGGISIHSRADVDAVPGGARVMFIPIPGQAAVLRDELVAHARKLSSGRCATESPK
jgi:hypothetical protein